VSLFGHHHADPSLADRALDVVRGIPLPIWVAVIGVAAAVATPLLQHLFTRSRDKSLAAADERRRVEERDRTEARVRADLLVRVRAHLVLLETAASAGGIELERWHAAFESLAGRTRDPDVIDALGAAYHDFVRPIHGESIALETERARLRGTPDTIANVTGFDIVVAAYDPVLRLLGDRAASPKGDLGIRATEKAPAEQSL
jgi:hypothetical protein